MEAIANSPNHAIMIHRKKNYQGISIDPQHYLSCKTTNRGEAVRIRWAGAQTVAMYLGETCRRSYLD